MNGSSRKKWNLKRFGKWVGERSEKDGDFFENGESFFLFYYNKFNPTQKKLLRTQGLTKVKSKRES